MFMSVPCHAEKETRNPGVEVLSQTESLPLTATLEFLEAAVIAVASRTRDSGQRGSS